MNEEQARTIAHQRVPRNATPVTLSELENYLAGAADLLRGSIDQADFKAYIFPLMFFKRISDVYLEEYGEALADSGGDHEFASFRVVGLLVDILDPQEGETVYDPFIMCNSDVSRDIRFAA